MVRITNPYDFKIVTPAPTGVTLQPITDPRDVRITTPATGTVEDLHKYAQQFANTGNAGSITNGSGSSAVVVPSNAVAQDGGGVDGQTILIAGIAALLLYKFVL